MASNPVQPGLEQWPLKGLKKSQCLAECKQQKQSRKQQGPALLQGYISLLHTEFGAVETTQAVQQKSVTMGAPISASASEKFMANQEDDIIVPSQVQMWACINLSLSFLKGMCCSLSLFNKQFHSQDLKRCRIMSWWSALSLQRKMQQQTQNKHMAPALLGWWVSKKGQMLITHVFFCLQSLE